MTKVINAWLTSDLKLVVLLGFEQWVGETVPRQLLAELRQQVVSSQTNNTHQRIQHVAQVRLEGEERGEKNTNDNSIFLILSISNQTGGKRLLVLVLNR